MLRFFLFWLLAAALYAPAWKGGFVSDFASWLVYHSETPFWDAVNRTGISTQSLYQVTQVELIGLTRLFGTAPLPWFLLHTGLFALCAFLLFIFFSRLFTHLRLPKAKHIALAGSLLFLLSPNVSEVVVWKAAFHYLTGLASILGVLILCQSFLINNREKGRRDTRFLWPALLLFAFTTFTLEIWYTAPPLLLCLLLCYRWSGVIELPVFRRGLRYLLLPVLLLFIGHFFLYHAVYGKWLPHGAYSSSTGAVDAGIMLSRLMEYLFHLLVFGRYWPQDWRTAVYHFAGSAPGVWSMGIAVASLLFLLLKKASARRGTGWWQAFFFVCAGGFLALLLVLHYGVDQILLVTNDRFLFYPTAFAGMLLTLLLSGAARGRSQVFRVSAAALIVVYSGFAAWTSIQWRHATKTFFGIQRTVLPFKDRPAVLLLNVPCLYKGIAVMYVDSPTAMNPHLKIFRNDSLRGKVYDVSSYNMEHPWDGATVTLQDSLHLTVTLNQWGTWWWYRTRGALDYETPLYSVHFTDPGHQYVLTLKQRIPGMAILYQQGEEWREVDMSRIGAEQR